MCLEHRRGCTKIPNIPQPHGAVGAPGGQSLPVGAEGDRGDEISVALEQDWRGPQMPQVPQPHGLVVAAGGQSPAVGAEGDRAEGTAALEHSRGDPRLPQVP